MKLKDLEDATTLAFALERAREDLTQYQYVLTQPYSVYLNTSYNEPEHPYRLKHLNLEIHEGEREVFSTTMENILRLRVGVLEQKLRMLGVDDLTP